QADGSFSFSGPRLEQINGGPLADGRHTLHLQAADEHGNLSSFFDASFTLDTRPPAATLDRPATGLATNRNVTIVGRATDAGSQVALIQAQTDAGSFTEVPVDPATGGFQFDTALATDGSQDGGHTVRVRAIDQAGNTSGVVDVSFTLNAALPTSPVF